MPYIKVVTNNNNNNSVQLNSMGIKLTCHFIYHKSHMTWPDIESGSLRWETEDLPPEPWHNLKRRRKGREMQLMENYI